MYALSSIGMLSERAAQTDTESPWRCVKRWGRMILGSWSVWGIGLNDSDVGQEREFEKVGILVLILPYSLLFRPPPLRMHTRPDADKRKRRYFELGIANELPTASHQCPTYASQQSRRANERSRSCAHGLRTRALEQSNVVTRFHPGCSNRSDQGKLSQSALISQQFPQVY
jgi:hypothetical protein